MKIETSYFVQPWDRSETVTTTALTASGIVSQYSERVDEVDPSPFGRRIISEAAKARTLEAVRLDLLMP